MIADPARQISCRKCRSVGPTSPGLRPLFVTETFVRRRGGSGSRSLSNGCLWGQDVQAVPVRGPLTLPIAPGS